MPRSNRPRGARPGGDDDPVDRSYTFFGQLRTEAKRGGLWNVHPISATTAVKSYTCPGCGLEITLGTAHVVTWRADGLLGEADDVAARRHWHSHCWKIT
ncbi:MAG: hypothetical protein ACYCZY_10580 [Lacisediminihabitans sp.]